MQYECPYLFSFHCTYPDVFIGGHTINSLMSVLINVCIFETKPCLLGLIFVVSSGVVNIF